jgi:hypothetical protein
MIDIPKELDFKGCHNFNQADNGIIIDFEYALLLQIFFESRFKDMQRLELSSKVIGNRLYIWERD